jgi:acetyl-CoA carboxylase biotin carboxyl carrier protein
MSPSKKTAPSTAPARRLPAARSESTGRGPALGLPDIQALIAQVGREAIDEFQLETGDLKLHIRKQLGTQASNLATAHPAPALPAPGATPAAAEAEPEPPEDPGIHHITSPIVGTFYRAPSSTSAPFVQPGDLVKPGQTLCIVEAMKLMNEIECDVAGEVVAVLVENGQPVEYGERLFAIRVR